MNLKIASLSVQHKPGIKSAPLTSGNGSGKFSSTLRELMNPAQSNAFHRSKRPLQSGLSPNKKYAFYLESLRKGLLAKGKLLTNISLKKEDLPLLKEFLLHSGFSKEDAEKILKDLAENHPGGEINLSKLFLKIAELGPPRKGIPKPITLEPSAAPYIESALRYLGLTPTEVQEALSAAGVGGGGLDLSKFVVRLKEISNRMTEKTRVLVDQNSLHQISKNLEGIGIQIPNKGKGEQISIQDFIKALEQLTGRMDKGNQLPADVKWNIDRILEKVVIAHERDRPLSLFLPPSELKLTKRSSQEKTGKEGKPVEKENLFSPLKGQDGRQPKVRSHSVQDPGRGPKDGTKEGAYSLKSETRTPDIARNAPSSPFSEAVNRVKEGQTKASSLSDLNPAPGLKRGAKDLNPGRVPKGGTKDGAYNLKSETRTPDIAHNTPGSPFSEAIHRVKEGRKMDAGRHSLPTRVMDQVGKQIARSIQRGERIIRFQLRPPDLGFMKVEMDIKDNVLRLGLITENSSVKELLLSHVQELKEALVQQGIKLEKVDIQINYNFNQSLANSKEELEEKQRSRREFNRTPFTGEGDMEDPQAVARTMATKDHLLDLVA